MCSPSNSAHLGASSMSCFTCTWERCYSQLALQTCNVQHEIGGHLLGILTSLSFSSHGKVQACVSSGSGQCDSPA